MRRHLSQALPPVTVALTGSLGVAFSGCPGEVKVSAPAYLIIFGDTLPTKGWVTERGRHKGTLFIADGEEGEKVIMLGGQPRYHPWGCGRE